MRFLTLQPRFISRPFVSLTQDLSAVPAQAGAKAAEIAEEGRKWVKNEGNLLLKQRQLTTKSKVILPQRTQKC